MSTIPLILKRGEQLPNTKISLLILRETIVSLSHVEVATYEPPPPTFMWAWLAGYPKHPLVYFPLTLHLRCQKPWRLVGKIRLTPVTFSFVFSQSFSFILLQVNGSKCWSKLHHFRIVFVSFPANLIEMVEANRFWPKIELLTMNLHICSSISSCGRFFLRSIAVRSSWTWVFL